MVAMPGAMLAEMATTNVHGLSVLAVPGSTQLGSGAARAACPLLS